MTGHSRRAFLTSTAGLAAGAAFIGTNRIASASPRSGSPTPGAAPGKPADAPGGQPARGDTAAITDTVVYVRDASTGAVVIMTGDKEQTVVAPALVAAIARAGRK